MPLFSDRKASEEAARKIVRLVDFREASEAPDAALTKWLETMPAALRGTLARIGLVDSRRLAASKTLSDHLDDFKAALSARGGTPAHVTLTEARARRVLEGCGFTHWSKVAPGAVHTFIAELRRDKKDANDKVTKRGISAASANYYRQSVGAFCRWMVRDGRASENPIAHLPTWNARADKRHERRALTLEELRWLLCVTANGPQRSGMTAPERVMLYRLALETGLRAGELRSLTRASFRLSESEPSLTVGAAYSKRRREDVVPLKAETASALALFLGTKAPAAPAFNMPEASEVPRMLKADLKAAREKWIGEAATTDQKAEREGMDFLTYRDSAGRVADFHALRHTFITNLASGGVHPKTAQALARHSTITLTMDRYSHTMRGDEADALGALPDLSASGLQAERATGTHGRQNADRHGSVSRRFAWREKADSAMGSVELGGVKDDPKLVSMRVETLGENRPNPNTSSQESAMPEEGVEPTHLLRVTDFESVASASSATPARVSGGIVSGPRNTVRG